MILSICNHFYIIAITSVNVENETGNEKAEKLEEHD